MISTEYQIVYSYFRNGERYVTPSYELACARSQGDNHILEIKSIKS